MKNKIKNILLSHTKVIQSLDQHKDKIETITRILINSLKSGGKLLICGNGGSAADAQHMAAEFIGRFKKKRGPLPALALTTDTSILTSIGNDFGFRQIFAKQIKGLGKKGDVLIAISTSGNSQNLIQAAKQARKLKITTIGILGKGGGKLKREVDVCLIVNSLDTPRIQEAHSLIIHTICELVEDCFS